jgi:hypothetical protein
VRRDVTILILHSVYFSINSIQLPQSILQYSNSHTPVPRNLRNYIFEACSVSVAVHRLVEEIRKAVQLGLQDQALMKEQQVGT